MKEASNSEWREGWLVIVNPNSGNRRGKRDWPVIRQVLSNQGFHFYHELTRLRGDATRIAREYIIKHQTRKIIVVGGDGTLNEAVNGIMTTGIAAREMILAMIPVGTGNDWCRMYAIQGSYSELVEIVATGKLFLQDVGVATYSSGDERLERYFVNVAGTGYDALVAARTNRMKELGRSGPLAYLYQLVKGLFAYRQANIRIRSGSDTLFEGDIFSVTIGICRYNGSGMMQVPDAIPDDGLLDLVVIRSASKPYILRNISKVYHGGHVKLPIVDSYRVRSLYLERLAEQLLFLEADGESLGNGPFEFGILPGSIRVVVAKTPDEQGMYQGSTQSP